MNVVAEPVELTDSENLSTEERERLILEHLPQVRMIARRIYAHLPGYASLDDLVSTGTLGLMSAIDRFDWSRDIQLKTYAEHKIKGAILDSLRRLDWAPRKQRKHAKQIEAATASAEQRLHRSPTEQEIAADLNLTVDGYHQWQVNLRGLNLARLESAVSGNSESYDPIQFVSGDPREWPSAVLERSELQRTLAGAIRGIPEIEKTILSMYYDDEMTLREIAKTVGRHESRISQLKAQAILRLRVSMAELWPAKGQPPSPAHRIETGPPGAAFSRSQAA